MLKKKQPPKGMGVAVSVKRKGSGTSEVVAEDRTEEKINSPVKTITTGERLVGMNKGYTINLGNYESAKIDCWMTRVVPDTDEDAMDALVEISDQIEEHLQYLRGQIE